MTKIDTSEGQDIMVLDFPYAFIQTNMPPKKDGYKRKIMKITGGPVYMLLELDSETYSKHMFFEIVKKAI